MAMSPTPILSQERQKIRVFRSSEGSSERITKFEAVSVATILATRTTKPGFRELHSGIGREGSVFALGEVPPF